MADIDSFRRDAREDRLHPRDDMFANVIRRLANVRTRDLTLPPEIHSAYLAHTWQSRKKINIGWMCWGAAVNAFCTLFAPFIVPADLLPMVLVCRAIISSVLIAGALAIYASPRHGAEGLITVAACLGVIAAAAFMVLKVTPELAERYVVHVIFMCGTAIAVSRIRWRDTVLLAISVIAALCAFIAVLPASSLSLPEKIQMAMFFNAGLIGLVLAKLAMNKLQYRVYVLGVSDRLKMADIEEMNGRLRSIARTDPLTGLSNRRHFEELFDAHTARVSLNSQTALLMIDIDHFKRLNDSRGHAAGDACLKAVAGLIRSELRSAHDFVARLGGEEFAMVLPETEEAEAAALAERVRVAIEQSGLANPGVEHGVVTASIGVAVSRQPQLERLIAQADATLYEAKSAGRNAVRVAGPVRPLRVA